MNVINDEMPDVVYFSLNNWCPGKDYPPVQPFIDWVGGDFGLKFRNEDWVIDNRLCIYFCNVDMSQNFCVTAPRKWVEDNCPELLTTYKEFVYDPEEDGDPPHDRFGAPFLEYMGPNIGITYGHDPDDDDYDYYEEEDEDYDEEFEEEED